MISLILEEYFCENCYDGMKFSMDGGTTGNVYREFLASGNFGENDVKFLLSPIFAISRTLNEDV